jgi:Helix-turn-helix domain
MSVRIMSRVWEHSCSATVVAGRSKSSSHAALLLMLAIADYCDDDGKAFPSVKRLAEKARLSERQTQRVLKALVGIGELCIFPNKGPNGVNVYQILMPPRHHVTGDTKAPLGVTQLRHTNRQEPSVHTQRRKSQGAKTAPSSEELSLDELVEQFAPLWPNLNVRASLRKMVNQEYATTPDNARSWLAREKKCRRRPRKAKPEPQVVPFEPPIPLETQAEYAQKLRALREVNGV